eukprot:gene13245-14545_t
MNDPPTNQQANPPNIPTTTAVREIPLVGARLRRVSSPSELPVATVEVLSSTPLIGVIDELQPQANSSLSFFDAERRESINDNLLFFDAVEPPENLQDTSAQGRDLRRNAENPKSLEMKQSDKRLRPSFWTLWNLGYGF